MAKHEETDDTDNVVPPMFEGSQYAFVNSIEKYVYQIAGRWQLDSPVGPSGIIGRLRALGVKHAVATWMVKHGKIQVVEAAAMFPKRGAVVTDSKGDRYLNVWVAPTLVPEAGEFPRIRVILDWLTAGDAEAQRWVEHWIARKVQDPGLVPKVALVLLGRPGCGKGTLYTLIREMLGPENCTAITGRALVSRFNARWISKLFVSADEIVAQDSLLETFEELKVLIAGDTVQYEDKGVSSRQITNHLAWMFSSNDSVTPVHVEAQDRRYTIVENFNEITPAYDAMLKGCFDQFQPKADFAAEMRAFYDYCLNLEVDEAFVSKPYDNEARQSLISASVPGHVMFLEELEQQGFEELAERYNCAETPLARRPDGDDKVRFSSIYAVYTEYCRQNGYFKLKSGKLGTALGKYKNKWPKVQSYRGRAACYRIPEIKQPKDEATGPQTALVPNQPAAKE